MICDDKSFRNLNKKTQYFESTPKPPSASSILPPNVAAEQRGTKKIKATENPGPAAGESSWIKKKKEKGKEKQSVEADKLHGVHWVTKTVVNYPRLAKLRSRTLSPPRGLIRWLSGSLSDRKLPHRNLRGCVTNRGGRYE
ncbi:hypothetical protein RUM44_002437 [Polyplax serrata]|uniref:Uncharacterized protein n=1 Tax=Polyplax serrata TaxID=468196 RepID=A0ABR1AER6_POLSC